MRNILSGDGGAGATMMGPVMDIMAQRAMQNAKAQQVAWAVEALRAQDALPYHPAMPDSRLLAQGAIRAFRAEDVLNKMRAAHVIDMKAAGKITRDPVKDTDTLIGMLRAEDQNDPIGHLISQLAYVEPEIQEITYAPIRYPALMPVSTQANEWARTITYFAGNMTGQAQWFGSPGATDMPYASEDREKKDVTVEMLAIGYEYDLQELNQALMVPGLDILFRKASAARFLMERRLDEVAMMGDSEKGYDGLFNATGVTLVDAPSDGAGGGGNSPLWANKTPAQIIRDVNLVLGGVYGGTRTAYMADTLLVPPTEFARLAGTLLPDSSVSVLRWIMESNVYTASTGRPLTIRGVHGLEDAHTGNAGRAVAYDNSMETLVFHMPMPHTFYPVWQRSSLGFEVPGIARTGGLEIRRAINVRYLNGITA